jgi:hypothetical protein
MWNCRIQPLNGTSAVHMAIATGDQPASFQQVLQAWREDAEFRAAFTAALAGVRCTAFRWECPPLTTATVGRPFECVLLPAPGLERQPEPAAFAEFFAAAGAASVVGFPSLGRDAFLISPCPLAEASVYAHLAAFLRGGPSEQVHALWQNVGREVSARLSERPLWLSTAGLGVAWLHVRLDSRPKYYGHRPYTSAP